MRKVNRKSAQHHVRVAPPPIAHFFLVVFPAPWFVFIIWYDVPSDAYIECWSRGDVCIVENACGADGPLGKNPAEAEPEGGV
jgi:hypothetical protein